MSVVQLLKFFISFHYENFDDRSIVNNLLFCAIISNDIELVATIDEFVYLFVDIGPRFRISHKCLQN